MCKIYDISPEIIDYCDNWVIVIAQAKLTKLKVAIKITTKEKMGSHVENEIKCL